MKPGEHPEFFRFPAPPGTSRESTIRIGSWGEVTHDGEPIERRELARAMLRWVSVHPDDGRFILTNGYDWCYVTVDDTPYFVEALRVTDEGLEVELSDDSRETLSVEAIRFDEHGFVARVKGSDLEARLLKQPVTELSGLLEEGDPVRIGWKGRSIVLPPRETKVSSSG